MRTFNGLQIFTDQLTNTGQFDLRYVRISADQSIGGNKNFLIRPTVGSPATGVLLIGEGGGSINIQDEGISQGSAGILNFVGAVTATAVGGTATINIPGGGGGTAVLPEGILYTSGLQTITGSKLISGVNLSFNFVSGASLRVSGNSVLTGVDLSAYLTSSTAASTYSTISNWNSLSGNAVFLSGPTQTINSSKLISGANVSFGFISGASLTISGNLILTGVGLMQGGTQVAGSPINMLNFAGAGVSSVTASNGVGQVNIVGGGGSSFVTAPATPSSAGTQYQMATDGNYFYVCTNTNTWRRVAIGEW